MATDRFKVVVCGGGIAGVEALLRLQRLASDRLRVTLVVPREELVYRPLAVREPFALPGACRYPLERIAADAGAQWTKDRLVRVDLQRKQVHTDSGLALPYDALLLAVGAREEAPYKHAHVFTDRNADDIFHGIVQDIELGYVKSIVFALPRGPAWPLPLYELALMTAQRAHSMNLDPQITFVTPEGRPLKAFGRAAGDAIVRLFDQSGIALYTGVIARVPAPGQLTIDGTSLTAQWIVTLPQITGPNIRGVPAGSDWFVPINERCVVDSTGGRVFAAGDATDFPVKHGGIGAQQADTASAGIAHLAGLGELPPPLEPVIRGTLLTGGRPLYFGACLVSGLGWQSQVYDKPPWPPEAKIVAEELGPYLERLDLIFSSN